MRISLLPIRTTCPSLKMTHSLSSSMIFCFWLISSRRRANCLWWASRWLSSCTSKAFCRKRKQLRSVDSSARAPHKAANLGHSSKIYYFPAKSYSLQQPIICLSSFFLVPSWLTEVTDAWWSLISLLKRLSSRTLVTKKVGQTIVAPHDLLRPQNSTSLKAREFKS